MKTSLYCLVIAVLLRLAFDVTGQTVVKQLPNGMYQIVFTSEFTKDLP
jgi:hypothetical protein